MGKRVLVVAAHPDDELLGVGGTAAALSDAGCEVFALILGEGQTSRWQHREDAPQDLIGTLHAATLDAARVIGLEEVLFENFPDNRFDEVALLDIVKAVEQRIEEMGVQVVYTHHGGDLNIDHQRTFQAVLTATRPIGSDFVEELYAFETLSSTEWNLSDQANAFVPNVFCDIGRTIERKCEAMRCYSSELCDFPHPRSIEGIKALAKLRGSTAGIEYAEAFRLIRKIQR